MSTYNNQELEIITDTNSNFKIFMNVLKYRSPHIHADFEIGMLMSGTLDIIYEDREFHMIPGDFMCINPYQAHELRSEQNAQILFVQINPTYFASTFPQIRNMEFIETVYAKDSREIYGTIHDLFMKLAICYMEEKDNYELMCASLLNMFFYNLLIVLPHKNISNSESLSVHNKAARLRRISDYIEAHHEEKITLADIAKQEGLTVTYLSHFFKDNFLMSFQDYLTKIRCEKARRLILTTDLSYIDISISCGFSDPKYFKKGFLELYGCTPKEYRTDFGKQKLSRQQDSMMTTQHIQSKQTSRVLIMKYMEQNTNNLPLI